MQWVDWEKKKHTKKTNLCCDGLISPVQTLGSYDRSEFRFFESAAALCAPPPCVTLHTVRIGQHRCDWKIGISKYIIFLYPSVQRAWNYWLSRVILFPFSYYLANERKTQSEKKREKFPTSTRCHRRENKPCIHTDPPYKWTNSGPGTLQQYHTSRTV